MKNYLTIIASFVIMVCIGSVYAWSILASELIGTHDFSASQSQIIFGAIIAIFPITMIFAGRLSKTVKYRYFGFASGLLFLLGYILAGFSQGNFYLILLGIGVMVGIGTGLGYWVALTAPVQWFPEKKGIVTGIASAGFGLGAIFMAEFSKILLANDFNVLEVMKIVGLSFGLLILLISVLIYQHHFETGKESIKLSSFIGSKFLRKLFLGIFLGSFAGLMIIGSLRSIGDKFDISDYTLVLGVSIFAITNFLGRLFWGFFSDWKNAGLGIFLSLLIQALAIFSLDIFPLSDITYLMVVLLIGFGYGGNFVLFAKETAHVYGVNNYGIIYPYVFLGYAIAGMAGPSSGGILFDASGSYFYPILLAGAMSLAGSLLFLTEAFGKHIEAELGSLRK